MLGRFWEGFGKPKWMPKSIFRRVFFRCFFRARFDIDFGWIFGASEPEKSTKTIVFSMVFVNFHRIDAFEQIAKKHRFWSRFRKPKPRQIEKKSRWKTCVFLTSIFWRCFWIFCDFGSILGSQKSIKNQNKSNKIASKNEKTLILGRALFGGRPPEGFGRVLGRFWESFERIWGGFGGVTLDGQAKPSQAKPPAPPGPPQRASPLCILEETSQNHPAEQQQQEETRKLFLAQANAHRENISRSVSTPSLWLQ